MRKLLHLLIFVGMAFAQLPSVPASPVSIIVDTDIGEDVGDMDACSVAVRLQQLGYVQLLGGVVTTNLTYGAAVLHTLFAYSGMELTQIGAYQSGISSNGGAINDTYASGTTTALGLVSLASRTTFAESATKYRQLLSRAADGSVTIVSHGFLTSLSNLLQTSADVIDGRTGLQLVTAKVSKLVIMGGHFPSGSDGWNIVHDITSAQYVVAHWPSTVPMYWTGDEVGTTVIAGSGINALSSSNPLKDAHARWGGETRAAWDEIAVIYGAVGANGYFTDSGDGTVTINGSGATSWASSPQAGQHYLIKARPDADFVTLVNSLLVVDTAAANVPGGSSLVGSEAFSGASVVR